MATMVCRGLQSCLDSHLVDQRTTLMLAKLSSPKPHFPPPFSDPAEQLSAGKNGDSGAWASLQALAGGPGAGEIYVHPLAKRSASASLSEKSLELCTENLGNESGTEMIENSIFSPEMELQRREKMKSCSQQTCLGAKKVVFPPPLTTIRESEEAFRVRPRREEGRLVIAAVKTPARKSCFLAERSNGRLRLSFSKPEEEEDEEMGMKKKTCTKEMTKIMNYES